MTVAVFANDDQWEELTNNAATIRFIRLDTVNNNLPLADAYFILKDINQFDFTNLSKPVFIDAVTDTLQSLCMPSTIVRINGWKGFLQRKNWEIAGDITEEIKQVLILLNKQYTPVPDEPGMIAARIIAMIINEAYFALGEEVSSKDEIDIAMKLGTNYPYGPFEWGRLIGIKNIFLLLQLLSATDKRYAPAPLLLKEATV